ncbi:MAG: DUF2277 domain-containing protein [Gemmatimonadota bacterium]
MAFTTASIATPNQKDEPPMCRNIKVLRGPEGPPTDEELEAASRQFVRKISGYTKPSQVNTQAFERAVADVAAVSRTLFDDLVVGRAALLR